MGKSLCSFLVSYSMLQTSDTATYNACIIIAAGEYQLLSSREKKKQTWYISKHTRTLLVGEIDNVSQLNDILPGGATNDESGGQPTNASLSIQNTKLPIFSVLPNELQYHKANANIHNYTSSTAAIYVNTTEHSGNTEIIKHNHSGPEKD